MVKNIPDIEVRNLSFSYSDGIQALDRVAFTVMPEEKVFILGPNGAGKSTLLLALLGFLNHSGEIIIKGEELTRDNIKEIRSKIGIVFQEPDDQIFMPSVYEDVLFGAKARFDEHKAEILAKKAVELTNLKGFETRLAHHLSYGERKRVAIASVLAMDPEIILFDEPTSNLDLKHKKLLTEILKTINKTMLIATHDMKLAVELADRIIIIKNGRIIADGNSYEILSDEELLLSANLEKPCDCEMRKLESRL